MRPPKPTSHFVRPTLETLEARDLPSSGLIGPLLTQSLSQIATQMSNAMTALRTDTTNLAKDLRGVEDNKTGVITAAPVGVTISDYTKSGFEYGQIQAFSQGLDTLGKADLAFILFSQGGSSQGNSLMLALSAINSDMKKANQVLTQATSQISTNPPANFEGIGFVSVLAALST